MKINDVKTRLEKAHQKLTKLAEEITAKDGALYMSRLSKIYYLIEQSALSEYYSDILQKLSYIHSRNYQAEEQELIELIPLVEAAISNILSNTRSDSDGLANDSVRSESESEYSDHIVRLHSKPRYTENTSKTALLSCINQQDEPIEVVLNGLWVGLIDKLWVGCKLHLLAFKTNHSANLNTIYSARKSIIVLEPDFLVDISEIATTFDIGGTSIGPIVLKSFDSNSSSYPMLIGNMVNSIFDEILINDSEEFDYYYTKALRQAGIPLFALANKGVLKKSTLEKDLLTHFHNLKKTVSRYKEQLLYTEPSFISTQYGLQGRLDLLVQRSTNNPVKDIVELKSGKPVNGAIRTTDKSGKYRYLNIWPSHAAQLTGYDLLLESAYPGRNGSSFILYSKDENDPVRNTLRTRNSKHQFIYMRNLAVAKEFVNAKDLSIPIALLEKFSDNAPAFSRQTLTSVINNIDTFNNLQLHYYKRLSSHISREIVAGRTGDFAKNPSSAFSQIWNGAGINERLISGLKLHNIQHEKLYVEFLRTDENDSPIRKGDAVFIFKKALTGRPMSNKFLGQVLKGTVRSINIQTVEITLRNKMLNTEVLSSEPEDWNMSTDFFDSVLKKVQSELFRFVSSSCFNVFIGTTPPHEVSSKSDKRIDELANYKGLSDEQMMLLKEAINAPNYYFLQGPPGTGKTSYFIKTLIQYLIRNRGTRILVTSFTNRAVDEICNAVLPTLEASLRDSIIRIGSKEGSELRDILLSEIIERNGLMNAYKVFKDANIIATTISSLTANREIFDIIDFDVAIIDEASQISEFYLSTIFSRVKKIVLIGDQKQLPPISVAKNQPHANDSLIPELRDPSESYFARMIRHLSKQPFPTASNHFGILTQQGRMDNEIMAAANLIAYEGKLKSLKKTNHRNRYGSLEAGINLIHINDQNAFDKKSYKEAQIVIEIIKDLVLEYPSLSKDDIGIISPFRKHCSLIRESLPYELRPYITVDTVERFQGSERKHIILSTSINSSTQLESILSVTEDDGTEDREIIDRKLNVALTRAKHTFTLVGNLDVLRLNRSYSKLIDNYRYDLNS